MTSNKIQQVDDQTRQRRLDKFGGVQLDDTSMNTAVEETPIKPEHEEENDTKDVKPDATVRPYALFLTGEIIGKLSTQQLLAYASEFSEPPPYGMEWIDDHRCVFVWHESQDFRQGWRGLLVDIPESGLPRHGQDHYFDLLPARNVPSTLSKIEPKDDSVQIRVRPATLGDVKRKTQYRNSHWYSSHGRRAGKIGDSPPRPERSRREVSPDRWQNDKADLDAELDGISRGDFRQRSPPKDRSRGRGRGRDRDDTRRRPQVNADDLDKELEDYLSSRN